MSRPRTLLIKTPEGVVFSQPLAGPIVRFLAWVIDFLCCAVVMIALNVIVAFISIITPDLAAALSVFFYFAVSVGYTIALEWRWRGQTIGKRLFRLRVVDAQGLKLQFSQVAIRNLLRVVDLLPGLYVVGGLATLITQRAQRLGDLAANTVVVRIPRILEPNLDQIGINKYNSLRAHPHLCARLRQRVSPAEAATALQAMMRRSDFDPAARVQLFADLAAHFKAKVDFPAETIDGIADEQYVRNVIDVLYQSGRATERVAPRETAAATAPA